MGRRRERKKERKEEEGEEEERKRKLLVCKSERKLGERLEKTVSGFRFVFFFFSLSLVGKFLKEMLNW